MLNYWSILSGELANMNNMWKRSHSQAVLSAAMSNLTLEKIAELAGVSRSTVSRVINGQAGVREDVRQHVWQVVNETGYRPNIAARALASNRSGIISLVVPHAATRLFSDPYFPSLIQGTTLACNKNELSLTLFLFHSEEEEVQFSRRIANASLFDGVIMASSQYEDPLIPQLIKNEVPFVMVGRQDRYPQVSFVDVDNLNGAYAATSHLLRLGYRRVAHIAGPQNMVAGEDRLAGYRKALSELGHSDSEDLVAQGDFSEAGGYVAMKRLLPARPDAVFAASDQLALGAWRAIREAGLRVPHDIALVGFDDLLPAGSGRPRLTTIRQPVVRAGREAVNVLLDIIENGPTPQRRVVFDTELVIRESCGASLVTR
jgi:LacI family transcriptional regulator, galactose operon repressor